MLVWYSMRGIHIEMGCGPCRVVLGLVASARSRPGARVGGGNPNLESQAVAYSEGKGARGAASACVQGVLSCPVARVCG